jgi:acyl transferase domain-containing protein/NADPH:quinone reductase-like Zn-dependent oxidoreductase/NAD(P)-dependent dehydrogenase (short-subunit alcohol dehydrogenase family)
MSGEKRLADLSAIRLALMAEETRAQSGPMLRADPIAIVGMACRTPGGADTPDKLWRLLAAGVQTTAEVPSDRFDAASWYDPDPAVPGKSLTTRGSFLDRIDLFDADYFSVPAREADQMDPQQRLALEAAIEAIDDAGAVHSQLRGSRSGVFMACYHSDYARLVYEDVEALDTRTLAGTLHGVVANRISHFLDLRGPSLTLDTGCSSSLVAIHLACQSLRLGETDFALAGGVSLMATPELFVAMTKVGFMSPDGECKTFDARADGFGRGEGCGMIALKRLSDAVADGDRILAVIRGSAVNQDGRSTVLTAPNGQAQEALVEDALEAAAVAPSRINFVEAHGTATTLGDPIEVEALSAVLGAVSTETETCYLGSAKANLGHLEAAAGVVGLIKSVEALRHGQIPPQPNFNTLSPHIRLTGTRLAIPKTLTPFPRGSGPRCAAVSSFGIGGTNAHVVLEEAPVLPGPDAAAEGAIWTLPLSAKTADGLTDLAQTWLDLLDDPSSPPIEDLCFTASQRRTAYRNRLAVFGKDKAELRARLAAAVEQELGEAPATAPRLGFVFSGQGPQWWAMGRQLMQSEPVYRAAMEACDQAISKAGGASVIGELSRPEAESRISETAIAQPAIFAVQTALVALWKSWGVTPAAVTGHSVGEIAALHAGGMLSLDEAARIVVKRGAIMQAATGAGRMAAVALNEAEARAVAAASNGKLDVAAINAPRSTVLSGDGEALESALAELAIKGVQARPLQVDYAFHSPQMADLATQFRDELGAVASLPAQLPVYSTLTGAMIDAGRVDGGYFADAIRKPVRFADAVGAMRAANIDVFVEIGPHPALAAAVAETIEARPARSIVASLRRERDEPETLRAGLAALYAAGVDPDWSVVQPADGSVVSLPTYPWRRRRYWVSGRQTRMPRAVSSDWVGAPITVAGAGLTILPVDPAAIAGWVGDHMVFGQVVVPGAAIAQALAAAAVSVSNGRTPTLEDLLIREPLRVEGEGDHWQITVTEDGEGLALSFYAQSSEADPWRLIAQARAVGHAPAAEPKPMEGGVAADLDGFFGRLAANGVAFGPNFRALTQARRDGDRAVGRASLPGDIQPTPGPHPALIDAGLQLATLACGERDAMFLPLSLDRAWLQLSPVSEVRLQAEVTSRSDEAFAADIFAHAQDGALVVALQGVRFVRAAAARFAGTDRSSADTYRIDWQPTPAASESAASGPWIVFEDAGGVAAAFAQALETAGASVLRRGQPVNEIGLMADLPAAFAKADVACFWPLDLDEASDDAKAYGPLLDLIHALAEGRPRKVLLVTKDAAGLDAVCVDAAAAARGAGVAALANVAALEHPELALRILDVDPLATPEQAGNAAAKALTSSQEPMLALRGEEMRAPRLQRVEAMFDQPMKVVQTGEGLNGVALRPFEPAQPGAGQLRVRVRAVGLNFRDALVALGAYPGGPAPMGAECAGIVEAVGPGVGGFSVGDRVACLAQGCLATQAIVRADLATLIPDSLGFAAAAAVPVAFSTADIGFRHFAGLQAGDRVLIHAATGGVGLAAVALAQRAGAEIFATAGTPEKRAYLRKLGVTQVFDSRALDFADQILAATDGQGVRVALNSLTGKFVGATLRALAKDGVLLELGKREVWTPQEVAAARPDVAYHLFDAGEMAEADPSLYQGVAVDVLAAMAAGRMAPSVIEVHPLSAAQPTLRRMAQARHMGKLVLAPPATAEDTAIVRADGAYLITGGFGGIGLQTASWLISRGAQHITLAGRGEPNDEVRQSIANLQQGGATISTARLDIAEQDAVAALLAQIRAERPLRGIVHAAGTPGNGLMRDLDADTVASARRGKVEGARVLRALTTGAELDFVVLCSSAAGLFGASGQGAYAAANAELEAIARQWRRDGARVIAVAWGPWADAGMFAAMSSQAQAAWRARGLTPMPAARAFAALEAALAAEEPLAVAAVVDWQQVFGGEIADRVRGLFSAFAPKDDGRAATRPAAENDLGRLRALPAGLQRPALIEALAKRARAVLDLAPNAPLPPSEPLKAHGLDSLMAVELRNQLARLGGMPLPVTLAFDYPTLDALAARLAIVWGMSAAPPSSPALDADLDEMSDNEAEALLAAELESMATGRGA